MSDNKLSRQLEVQQQIELLVDNELSDDELQMLVSRMDDQPELWRHCAMAFINESTIQNALSVPKPSVQVPMSKENLLPTTALRPMSAVVVACICFVLGGLSYSILYPREDAATTSNNVAGWMPDQQSAATALPRRQLVSFGGTDGPKMIVEVQNTPSQAVYYVDYQVPRFLLEALVNAGHSVQVSQQMIPVGTEGEEIEVPINKIIVDKYALTQL